MALKNQTPVQIPLYNLEGESVRSFELTGLKSDIVQNPTSIAQYVRVHLANQREGSASTKTRSEINATGKKVYRQKGTGGARHGSRRAPIFVGGGVASGPRPRDFSLSLNKKQKHGVFAQVVQQKVQANALSGLVTEANTMEIKSKIAAEFLKKRELSGKKVLVVVNQDLSSPLSKSMRNIKGITLVSVGSLNAYELLNFNTVIFAEDALSQFNSYLS